MALLTVTRDFRKNHDLLNVVRIYVEKLSAGTMDEYYEKPNGDMEYWLSGVDIPEGLGQITMHLTTLVPNVYMISIIK